MNSLFQAMRHSLQTTAKHLGNSDVLSDATVMDHLEYTRNVSGYFNSIFWADTNAVVQNMSPPALSLKGTTLTATASLEALATRGSYLSEPFISSTGRLIVLMSEPLYDKTGNYIGIIGGTIYLADNNVLSTIFGSNISDHAGSYFYVVDSRGTLVYHPERSRLHDRVTDNQVVQQLMNGRSGQAKVENTKSETFLAGYATVPDNGWGIVVQTPVETINKQLRHQILATSLYTGPPFLIIVLTAIYVARKLASPFVVLTKYLSQSKGGTRLPPPVKPNYWNLEANVLTRMVVNTAEEIHKHSEELSHAALVDPLTGLHNRRALKEMLEKWTSLNKPFGLIIMDIDRFKSINDTFGHQVGDEILKQMAGVIQRCMRAHDIGCRYGGEEFIVMLPGCNAAETVQIAERIRQTMEKEKNVTKKTITLSLGAAVYPVHGVEPRALLKMADDALYTAKESGRNRTVLAGAANSHEPINEHE
ncbi:sensor domain-containing diguanylate cyclase [Paenibacillus curdlanolyticus]|nr:sensor domain-containing diguanylate cyclase [Paenibacillus curdlanolyticus]